MLKMTLGETRTEGASPQPASSPSKKPPRPRGPKAVRVDPSHLLDAAQMVFARDGVEGGSMRAIAREAGCDPSLIYYHFENKDAVFSALLERKFGALIPDMEDVARAYEAQSRALASAASAQVDTLRMVLREALWATMMVLRAHLENDAGFRFMVRGMVMARLGTAQGELVKYLLRLMRILCGYFDGGIRAGIVRADIDMKITAFLFMRAYVEIMDIFPTFSSNFVSMPPEDAIALAEKQWFTMFWAGIAVPGSPARKPRARADTRTDAGATRGCGGAENQGGTKNGRRILKEKS